MSGDDDKYNLSNLDQKFYYTSSTTKAPDKSHGLWSSKKDSWKMPALVGATVLNFFIAAAVVVFLILYLDNPNVTNNNNNNSNNEPIAEIDEDTYIYTQNSIVFQKQVQTKLQQLEAQQKSLVKSVDARLEKAKNAPTVLQPALDESDPLRESYKGSEFLVDTKKLVNSSEYGRFTGAGEFGINTQNPEAWLHVVGSNQPQLRLAYDLYNYAD